MKKRRHVVRFSGITERPALSLNRGFSAPVTLSVEQRREDQFFLARHDSDPFSRWQAYNTLLTEALIAAFRNGLGGKPPEFSEELVELAGVIAADEKLEHAFRALALALPGEADIAREIGKNIDPDVDLRQPRGAGGGDRPSQRRRFAQALRRARIQGPLQPRRRERRPPRAAQHAARLSRDPAGRRRACCQAFRRRHQHDRPRGGADRADAPACRHRRTPGMRWQRSRSATAPIRWSWTSGCRSRRPRRAPARSTRSGR